MILTHKFTFAAFKPISAHPASCFNTRNSRQPKEPQSSGNLNSTSTCQFWQFPSRSSKKFAFSIYPQNKASPRLHILLLSTGSYTCPSNSQCAGICSLQVLKNVLLDFCSLRNSSVCAREVVTGNVSKDSMERNGEP
jgi:hypothetical protein